MPITHHGTAIFVKDIADSRRFYEELLQQPVQMDNGPHVSFGALSIWHVDHASESIFGDQARHPGQLGARNLELCFETDQLERIYSRAAEYGASIIHQVVEQPWGQRVFRMYDPDHHIVSVAEPLTASVRRLLDQGLSVEEVARRTTIPVEMVNRLVGG
jgi:catechol 2,3-dioxygenase-like lactoylglutathione lyase family enzyme